MASKSKKLSLAADIFEQDIEGIIRKISMSQIVAAANQPRTHFDDEGLQSLADSIRTEGLMQPIVVTKEGTGYKIIAGERRFRAASLAGFTEIECRILRKNPKDTFRLAVIENLQRENLNAVDEAKAFRKLKEEYDYNDSDLAKIVGKSRNYINEILSVADIPSPWLARAQEAGIESKNLFIQFAQAVKGGSGDQFIDAYQSGSMKTVAAAKQFNKAQKADKTPAQKTQPLLTGIKIRSEAHDKNYSITLNFTASSFLGPEKIKQLEKNLTDTLRRM